MHTHNQRTRMVGAARVVGTLLAAALASSCGTAAVSSPSVTSPVSSPTPAGPTPFAAPEPAFTEADVGRIVLGEADAPAGASYLGTDVGREVLINPVWYLSSSEQQRFRDLPGFIHASASSYRLGSTSADPLFVSEVMLFDDTESAAHAMAAYVKEWESSFGFADPMPSTVELGEEGLLFSGPAAVQNGEPGFYYFWRVNNLLLNMIAVGPVEGAELDVMETTVRAMALEMDRRAGKSQPSPAAGNELCQPQEPNCIGPLAAGTHSTANLLVPLSFTMPSGWQKNLDDVGVLNLALTVDPNPFIGVWPDPVVAAQDCRKDMEPGVGRSVDEIVAWLTAHKGIAASDPIPVSIGGLDGQQLDLSVALDWTRKCAMSHYDDPSVPFFVHDPTRINNPGHFFVEGPEELRAYLLDAGDGHTVLIGIVAMAGNDLDRFIEVATPVVESIEFAPR